MKISGFSRALVLAATVGILATGCDDDTMAPAEEETALLSVIPQGGATGVGGQWMTQQMHQGGQHGYGGGQGGMGGGMGGGTGMGAGWTHPTNGSYGMVFVFMTA